MKKPFAARTAVCPLLCAFLLSLCCLLTLAPTGLAAQLYSGQASGLYQGQYLLVQNNSESMTSQQVGRFQPQSGLNNSWLGEGLSPLLAEMPIAPAQEDQLVWREPDLPQIPWAELDPAGGEQPGDGSGINQSLLQTSLATNNVTFYSIDDADNTQITITANCLYDGTYCKVYGETTAARPGISHLVTAAEAQTLGTFFDTVAYPALKQNIGDYDDLLSLSYLQDSKLILLLYDIRDDNFYGNSNQFIGGYFYSFDLLNYSNTNRLIMLHIESRLLDWDDQMQQIKSTVVHEGQHLINYAVDGGTTPSWLNEASSMAAEEMMFGVLSDRIQQYNASQVVKNGATLTYEEYGDNAGEMGACYGLPYLFGQYLRTQTEQYPGGGRKLFKAILDGDSVGRQAVCDALAGIGYPVTDFDQLYRNFLVAATLKQDSGYFGFGGDSDYSSVQMPVYGSTTDSSKPTYYSSGLDQLAIKGGGALLLSLPSPVTVATPGSSDMEYTGFAAGDGQQDVCLSFNSQAAAGDNDSYNLRLDLTNYAADSRELLAALSYLDPTTHRMTAISARQLTIAPDDSGQAALSLELPAGAAAGLRLYLWQTSGYWQSVMEPMQLAL